MENKDKIIKARYQLLLLVASGVISVFLAGVVANQLGVSMPGGRGLSGFVLIALPVLIAEFIVFYVGIGAIKISKLEKWSDKKFLAIAIGGLAIASVIPAIMIHQTLFNFCGGYDSC